MVFRDKVLLAPDEAGFFKKAGQIFVETAAEAVRERGRFVAALSGGNTPKKLYELLAQPYFRDRIPWAETYLFWGDERCVPPHHPESNFGAVQKALLSRVPVPSSHVFRVPGEMPPAEAARSYESNLKSFFKLEYTAPEFDLILLGVGEDGHTASLFPGTEAVKEKNRWVVSSRVPSAAMDRVTFTFPLINAARRILFLCSGVGKSTILKEVLRDDLPRNRFPAQMVSPDSGELVWLLDPAAAAKLPAGIRHNASHL